MKGKHTMKAYTFSIEPTIAQRLRTLGIDPAKVEQAIESHGNQSLKITDTDTTSKNTYRPESGTKTVKPASSGATTTIRTKMEGDGSDPRYCAGLLDAIAAFEKRFGEISGKLPLTARASDWLGRFKLASKPSAVKAKVKGGNLTLPATAARVTTPAPIATVSNGNGNGHATVK